MKSIVLSVLLLCLAASVSMAEEFQFRNVFWGMSQAEVKAAETAAPIGPQSDMWRIYAVNEAVYGVEAQEVIYGFIGDELFSCSYTFGSHEAVTDALKTDFDVLESRLKAQYGAPDFAGELLDPDEIIYTCGPAFVYQEPEEVQVLFTDGIFKRTQWQLDGDVELILCIQETNLFRQLHGFEIELLYLKN